MPSFEENIVHIALCMSVGWSVFLDSRFPTTCETYNKDLLTQFHITYQFKCRNMYNAHKLTQRNL